MAAERGRVVTEEEGEKEEGEEEEEEERVEEEEPAASGAVTRAAHTTRSQSHVQFQPRTHSSAQWQPAPRALAPTRSHSHTHFTTPRAHTYGGRLTHSLSAMAGARGSTGKLIKPTDPLFPKTPRQVRLFFFFFFFFFFIVVVVVRCSMAACFLSVSILIGVCAAYLGRAWLVIGWRGRGKQKRWISLLSLSVIHLLINHGSRFVFPTDMMKTLKRVVTGRKWN